MNRYYEGIKVYPAWRKNPLAFCIWCLKHGWRQGLTIDRICNWYGYNPRNVRFVTRARNLANRKRKGHQGFRGRRNDLPMNIQQTPEGKYVAMFVRDGIRYRVGSFNTLIKASRKLETKIKQVEKAMYAH